MVNYVLLLDKNQTTDQKVVSSNPAGCAIKPKPLVMRGFGLMVTKVPPPKSH